MDRTRVLRTRYRRIMGFFAQLITKLWFFEALLPRLGLRRLAARGQEKRLRRYAQQFHDLAADLGGLMIKVGQFMSTRLDVLPASVTDQLAGLQDEAPPVPFDEIRQLLTDELMMPLDRAFSSFDEVPLAAASLGQAHRAHLTAAEARDVGFRNVVVKVQRPGIGEITDVDLSALRKVAGWLAHYKPIAERTDVPALIEEFARTTAEELDYLHEASNTERFSRHFADDPTVGSPTIVWERTTRHVLTESDVTAIKISDVEAIKAAGIDPKEVAFAVADAYIEQVFNHGFFHADPHPGNLFLTPVPKQLQETIGCPWRITFIDFGMMGTVQSDLREELKEVVIAVGLRDSHRLLRCMQDLDVLLPSADLALIERAISQMFDRFGGMSLADMRSIDTRELIAFGSQFRDLMSSMPFQLPHDFLLLIRAASLMNGLCVELYSEYNLWDSVEPYAQELVLGTTAKQLKVFSDEARSVVSLTLGLPRRVDRVLTMIERGQLSVQYPGSTRMVRRNERSQDRVISSVIFAGLLIGGILVRPDIPVLGLTMMGISLLPLGKAIFGSRGPRAER